MIAIGSRDPLYITLAIGQGSGSMFVCYGLILEVSHVYHVILSRWRI